MSHVEHPIYAAPPLIETACDLEDIDTAPPTVVGRIREFYNSRHWVKPNVWPEESSMYAVLHSPGRATNVQSDGGMAVRAHLMSHGLSAWARVYEFREALGFMPKEFRDVIEATYDVHALERPRSVRAAAGRCKMSTGSYGKTMAGALAWLQGRLCLQHRT